jgi:hypothetical protein
MKLGICMLAIVAACATASAQNQTRKSTTQIVVEDGESVTVNGCLQRNSEGSFTLTHTAGKEGVVGSYLLVPRTDEDDLDNLDKHIGHRVEVSGKAADRGNGKIRVETKNETRSVDGRKARTESTSEVKGDLSGLPYLGVKSFRMLATVCP